MSGWAGGVRLEALANLAHELRTPLQVMLGYIDLLRGDWGDGFGDEPRRILERMNGSACELARTVENLMDFATSESDADTQAVEPVSIESLIAELIPSFEAANETKGLALEFDLDDAPAVVQTRRRSLRLILQNLIFNAIKFTSAGSVAVTVRHCRAGVEIEVRDSGPGISPEQIESAYEPLVQLSHSSIRRYRGMGLGLSVVRRNVTALGGEIEARSTPGAGSTFVVRLPAAGAEDSRRAPAIAHKRGRTSTICPLPIAAENRAAMRRQSYR
ncbi:MAG: sensor histidine kinase [Candidatus Binatales bacterium]